MTFIERNDDQNNPMPKQKLKESPKRVLVSSADRPHNVIKLPSDKTCICNNFYRYDFEFVSTSHKSNGDETVTDKNSFISSTKSVR